MFRLHIKLCQRLPRILSTKICTQKKLRISLTLKESIFIISQSEKHYITFQHTKKTQNLLTLKESIFVISQSEKQSSQINKEPGKLQIHKSLQKVQTSLLMIPTHNLSYQPQANLGQCKIGESEYSYQVIRNFYPNFLTFFARQSKLFRY